MASSPTINSFWWTDVPNFGDRLAPHLLSRFAEITPVHAPIAEAEVVSIGSVLQQIPVGWEGWIAGAGKIRQHCQTNYRKDQVLGVRGPLSAAGLGDVAIGDPGLLAAELVEVETREYKLGIIPHWSDTRLAHDRRFQVPGSVVISPFAPPLEVVSLIGKCDRIVTSSLHGVIVADAYHLPRRIEVAKRFIDDDAEGHMFKFHDYHASIDMPMRIGEIQLPNPHTVNDRKDEVYDMLRMLGSVLNR